MDETIFAKMKARPDITARVFNAPSGYPKTPTLIWKEGGDASFVHLFVETKGEFTALFPTAASSAKAGALFWLSYPKAAKGQRIDINRDSLWDLVLILGWHPVAQVSLDERWSAISLKINKEGERYLRPGSGKPPQKTGAAHV